MELVAIKVASSFLVGGEIARPGEIVEVTNSEAKDLLHRGMAVLATADDVLPEADEADPVESADEASDAEIIEGDASDADETAPVKTKASAKR